MNDVHKRLVFHFYCDNDYKSNRAIKIHLQCLKHYSSIFDEALFCICVDDLDNTDLIQSIEHDIIGCGFNDIRFKLVKNTSYREAKTFYDEIATKINELYGITFFGHTKGYTNYKNLPYGADIENLDTWITGLYFLSLSDLDDVKNRLLGPPMNSFYGSFLSYCKEIDLILYSGTFYWINAPSLNDKIKNNIPLLDNCTYAENFLSKIFKYKEFSKKGGYNGRGNFMSFVLNNYCFANKTIKGFLNDDIEEYLDFKEKILKEI